SATVQSEPTCCSSVSLAVALALLLEPRSALVADLVVTGGEQMTDVVVLVHPQRLAIGLEHFGHHPRQEPPVAQTLEDPCDVFVHRPARAPAACLTQSVSRNDSRKETIPFSSVSGALVIGISRAERGRRALCFAPWGG